MQKGLDLRDDDKKRQRRREAHSEEARLREENKRLSIERDYHCLRRVCDWPTLAESARMVGAHRGTIGRAVLSGKIEAVGVRGKWIRISPTSLRDYRRKRAARMRAEHARWADAID